MKNLFVICSVSSLAQSFALENVIMNRDCHEFALFLAFSLHRERYWEKITYLLFVICKRFDILKFIITLNKITFSD